MLLKPILLFSSILGSYALSLKGKVVVSGSDGLDKTYK
jgi:hypothetical protein